MSNAMIKPAYQHNNEQVNNEADLVAQQSNEQQIDEARLAAQQNNEPWTEEVRPTASKTWTVQVQYVAKQSNDESSPQSSP